jgi:hypothetical protein
MPRNLSTKVISCSKSTITLLQRYGMKFAKTIMKFVRDPLVLAYSSKIRHQHFLCIYMKQQTHRLTDKPPGVQTQKHPTHTHTHTHAPDTQKQQTHTDAHTTQALKKTILL